VPSPPIDISRASSTPRYACRKKTQSQEKRKLNLDTQGESQHSETNSLFARLTIFLEKLLRLVNFTGEVRTAATIGVVSEHQAPVVLADLLFRERAFAQVEDQAGLAAVHLLLEAAFVERPS